MDSHYGHNIASPSCLGSQGLLSRYQLGGVWPCANGTSLLMFVSCTQCQHKALLVLPLLREKNCVKQMGDKTSLPLDTNEVSKWERYRVQTGHLLSSNKAFSTSTWLHPIELLAQGVPWKSWNSPSCCQDCRLLSTNWLQVFIAEDNTHITHGTWRSRADAYTQLSSLCSSLEQDDTL